MTKKRLLKYFKSVEFIKAFLVAVAMLVPVFVSVYFFDSFDIGIGIALGVVFCAPSDISGSFRHKFYGMVASIILSFAVTFLIGSFSTYLPVLIPLLTILIFSISYISVFGFRASLISVSGLLALVLAFAQQNTSLSIFEYSLFIGLGGVWYMLLSIITQLLLPRVQVDSLFVELLEKTSKFIKIRGRLLVEIDNRSSLLEKIFALQTELNELHETIREVILEKRLVSGFNNRTRRQQLIFSRVMEIYELAISNTIDYDEFDALFKDHPEKVDEFKLLVFEISRRLNHLSRVILKVEKLKLNNDFEILIKKIDNHIELYKTEIGLPESREGTIFLLNYKAYYEKQISNLNDIVRVMYSYSKNDKISGIKDAEKFITYPDYNLKKLKINFSFKSATFRHSLRLTLTMMLGFLVGVAMELQQSYWILLTIVVIMRPGFGLTKQRTKHRVVGTLIGAGLGIGIIFLTQNPIIYGLLAFFSLLIGFSLMKQNYRNAAAFITLYVIFMYALIHPNIIEVIEFRVLDTLIGSLLAYLGNYFFWPAWESKNIKDFLSNSIDGFIEFLNKIDELYHVKGEVSTGYSLARKKAFLNIGDLNAAYQRLIQEPKSKQENSSTVYGLITVFNTYLSALSSLGMYIRTNKTGEVPAEFEVYVKHIISNLEQTKAILSKTETNTSLQTKELEKATKNYSDYYESLTSVRDKEIEKGVPISDKMRMQLHETQLVSQQVKWLLSLSKSLLKKVKKI